MTPEYLNWCQCGVETILRSTATGTDPYPYFKIEVSPYTFRTQYTGFNINPYRLRTRTIFQKFIRTRTVSVLIFEKTRTRSLPIPLLQTSFLDYFAIVVLTLYDGLPKCPPAIKYSIEIFLRQISIFFPWVNMHPRHPIYIFRGIAS